MPVSTEDPAELSASAEPSPKPQYKSRWAWFAGRRVDALMAGVLGALTFVVHSLHYILSVPFWLDESWVAVSTKLPLRQAPHVTSASPLGWTVLLRGMFFGGPQGLRLIPLAFGVLSVIVAYLIGRTLPSASLLRSRLSGALTGLAVLLAPSSLVRNDLKPYTADAFVALTLILLLNRLESGWSRRRLGELAGVALAGFLISTTALFVTVAIFATLVAVALIRRDWRRALEAGVAATATAIGLAVLYAAFYAPHVQDSLTSYWRNYYLPVSKGLGRSLSFLQERAGAMASYIGMGPLLLVLVLITAGGVTMYRSGRVALACTFPVLLVEMISLGAARKYPIFDERTSHFFTAMLAVLAAIGVGGLSRWLARRSVAGAMTALAVLVALFVVNVSHDIRDRSIPREGDARTAAAYISSHFRPHDIIVVSSTTSFAFGYYWDHGTLAWRPSKAIATGFQPYYPGDSNIIVAANRDPHSVQLAMDAALSRMKTIPGARMWLIRIHVNRAEDPLWIRSLVNRHLTPVDIMPCTLQLVPKITSRAPDPSTITTCEQQ